jgi:hypothetical protein
VAAAAVAETEPVGVTVLESMAVTTDAIVAVTVCGAAAASGEVAAEIDTASTAAVAAAAAAMAA